MARRTTAPTPPPPRVRRSYFDCRYGQLHVHHAIPASGGFDEAPPLLCLPGPPGSGRFFLPRLAALGADRSIYAPDLPGCGESDPPPAGAGAHELAAALGDFLDSMRLRRVDLLAHGDGTAIALALLAERGPAVGRVVVSGAEPAGLAGHPVMRLDLGGPDVPVDSQVAELKGFLGLT
ncbi:MAG: alpha/beta fold hydrolase [Steroidobacteraceae bacterium]